MLKKIFGTIFFIIGVIFEIIGYANIESENAFEIVIGVFLIILGISMIVVGDGEDGYKPKEKISKTFFDNENGENKWVIK